MQKGVPGAHIKAKEKVWARQGCSYLSGVLNYLKEMAKAYTKAMAGVSIKEIFRKNVKATEKAYT